MDYNYSERMSLLNGSATREILKLLTRPEIISFAGGFPATQCLPQKEVQEIAHELLAEGKATAALQYGTTEGFVPLREQCIEYVKTSGIENIELDQTLVISGGQQGLDLMSKTFLDKGDVVLVENPTYLTALQIFQSYQAKIVGVNSDKNGLDIEDLENKIIQYKPKMLYIVPTFSNPTGKVYSVANRKEIASITAKYNVMVIEDDPYGKLRFEGEPVPALKSFDTHGNVVYVTSFSKVLAPGLRVAVAVGSKEVIRKLTICKQGVDVSTSNLSQLIVSEYLRRGYLFPNIEKSLPIYRERKNAMIDAINKYMPEEYSYINAEGGLFIWGEFNAPINTVELAPEAIKHDVAYIQGQVFFADGSGLNTLRLNFSNASPDRIDTGIHRLGDMFKAEIAKLK
ncbi:MAG: PLP-dependent aminotransferase family protein [Clostridiales bacterium]|nr:PLP-dependent aminotransferase family protein [Clostridiales bacterium]